MSLRMDDEPDDDPIEALASIFARGMMHFTPTSASWLNQVERVFAELTNQRLRHGVHRSVIALEGTIRDYLDHRNDDAKPFAWTADADRILGRVQRHCQRGCGACRPSRSFRSHGTGRHRAIQEQQIEALTFNNLQKDAEIADLRERLEKIEAVLTARALESAP